MHIYEYAIIGILIGLTTATAILFKEIVVSTIRYFAPERELFYTVIIFLFFIMTQAYLLYVLPEKYHPRKF